MRSTNILLNPGLIILALTATALAGNARAAAPQDTKEVWRVPSRHARKTNPLESTPATLAAGKAVFVRECLSCHGDAGRGDGPASKDLEVKPADFSDLQVRKQTDGALYWMISTGRSPMPTFKDSLTADERWQVVSYIRTLAPPVEADPLGGFLESYGELHAALGASAAAPAAKAAAALAKEAKALAAFDPPKFSKTEGAAWTTQVEELHQAADSILAAKEDLGAIRASFAKLSAPLAASLKMLPSSGREVLRVFRCPHAFGGKAATWLQTGEKAVNPFTAEPPDCGELQDQIPRPSPRNHDGGDKKEGDPVIQAGIGAASAPPRG
ncbi:MAG: DUF3347 domain-containing protein [Planctomycetes bacterium]|nr:DUF3347 domain-containing protein [Planctomycetota bacterium]